MSGGLFRGEPKMSLVTVLTMPFPFNVEFEVNKKSP